MILAALVSLFQPALKTRILAHTSIQPAWQDFQRLLLPWLSATGAFTTALPSLPRSPWLARLPWPQHQPSLPSLKVSAKPQHPAWRGNSSPLCLHGATIYNFWPLCVLKIWDLMLPSNSPFFLHTTLHLTILRQTCSHLHSLFYPSGPNTDKLLCACFASTVCCIFTCPSNYSLSILFHWWFVNKF